ncbi:hypothetical protein PP304_gp130 [Gordonia phage Phendrix]|uniref:Uncharacterized protein n=2 Tax=Gordonia phage Phendrix TaxID=2593335 RepID=A0A514U1F0_9CAUD|nr:hypothetical protein PP304_gp130 [Gordonia phage Phendrix]QDK02739.1 hypothetical protein SEA_PHENDRIX_223 [Gordonia phage Phendrix]
MRCARVRDRINASTTNTTTKGTTMHAVYSANWYGEPIMTVYIDLPFSANDPGEDDVNDSTMSFVPIPNKHALSGEGTPVYRVYATTRDVLAHYIREIYMGGDVSDDSKQVGDELIDEIKEVV